MAYLVSDIIDGHLIKRRYYGYTKKESERMFKHDIKYEKRATSPKGEEETWLDTNARIATNSGKKPS